jgi:putative acetyltransferase
MGQGSEMLIRPERIEDIQEIRSINLKAFDTVADADLVEALRKSSIPLVSLVAEQDGELVGHILFSPTVLEEGSSGISIAGLAPTAVLPACQKKGIGSMLVEEGLMYCKSAGYAAVVVLGTRITIHDLMSWPSVSYGITSEYDAPPEVFMAKEMNYPAASSGVSRIQKTEFRRQNRFPDRSRGVHTNLFLLHSDSWLLDSLTSIIELDG